MNPPVQGIFPYVGRYAPWVDWLSTQFDYAWFLALLGWSFVLALWWWHPRRSVLSQSAWAWLPWTAASGLLIGATEFVVLNLNPMPVAKLTGDMVVGSLLLLAPAGWWWEAARARSGWVRVAFRLLPLPLAAIAAWRFDEPQTAGWWMVGAALVSTLPWWRAPRAHAWSRLALFLAALAPLCSNVGPLAIRLNLFQRNAILNVGMLAAGAFQAIVAGVALWGLARDTLRTFDPGVRGRVWREARPFVVGAALWFAAGVSIATLIGQNQRASSIRFAFEPIHRVAMQFDPDLLARTIGPAFQLAPGSLPPWQGAMKVHTAYSPHLATDVGEPIRRLLINTARTSRGGLKGVNILTLRDGWLVIALSSAPQSRAGEVRLARPATEADLDRWARKAEVFEGPISFNAGGHDLYRLPLLSAGGDMLGWLEFAQARGSHDNAGVQKRTTPFVATALGLVIAALFFVQQQNIREREAAVRAAAVAAESARVKVDFLAKVSHELRTPLQSILGYGARLAGEVSTDSGRAQLRAVQQQSELMLRLVNDLIDLNAIDAGVFRFVPRAVNVTGLVQQTVESLRPRAEAKGLALQQRVDARVPAWVATDAERLRQVVLNLVGNAIKFTERGGVDVALAVTQSGAGREELHLAVRDTGPGIMPADLPRLFQPFSRLESTAAQEGTGIGLALVAAICRSAGGSVSADSDGRTGAEFRVRLPLQLAVAPVETAPAARTNLRGRRVLVADDNVLVRELFASYLGELGATCDQAADGEEALARARGTPYDALVLDLTMPRLSGLEVTRRLRGAEAGTHLHIVGVSAHAADADRDEALRAGMNDFLIKPVELTTLATAVGRQAAEEMSAARRAELHGRLANRFRGEAATAQAAAIGAAIARAEWRAVKLHAHYLKSSASVVQDDRLYHACTALEDAADAADAAAVRTAWAACQSALQPWLPGSAG
ncbi:MAG TPA: ATP-binding protein [Opitutaceae bacterium]|nr:ATP-binding protein [Opitutaceae bacterium]